MSILSVRRSMIAFAVAASLSDLSVSIHAAEAGKGGGGAAAGGNSGGRAPAASNGPSNNNGGPTVAPANNSPANNAPANVTPTKNIEPNANHNAGQFNTAPGVRNANDPNGRNLNNDRRQRTVYMPGYGYSNWNGDYSSPYWSTPGSWYNNDGYQAPLPTAGAENSNGNTASAPAAPIRPEEQAAQSEMSASRARLAAQFESNDEVRAALRDVQAAQKEYDAAVAKSNRQISKDPDYQQAQAEKQQAAKKVEAVQAANRQPVTATPTTTPAPFSPAVIRAAEQKLNAASEVSAITADHAQSDPAVVQAREKLEAAAEKLNGMKDRFDAAMKADPQWLAAKQRLDTLRASDTR